MIKLGWILPAVLLGLFGLPLFGASTTGAATIYFPNATSGPFNTSNWESSDYKGTASRQWDGTGDSFTFTWNTTAGDQIGQIGVTYGSSYLATNYAGVQVDSLSPNCVMSTSANESDNGHWFYWSIYGWTHSSYTYWSNTPNGWDNEFYIVCYTNMTAAAILAGPGCVSKGSVTVDGVTYDCYATIRTSQSQWLAVARTKSFGASVNLQKIFAYWRSQGMANDYVVSLGWALEGFNGSAGTIQLSNIVIPNLTLQTPANATSADTPVMPKWMPFVLVALLVFFSARELMLLKTMGT